MRIFPVLSCDNSGILSSLSLRHGLGSAVTFFLARLLLPSDLHRTLFRLLLGIIQFRFVASRTSTYPWLVPDEDGSRVNYSKFTKGRVITHNTEVRIIRGELTTKSLVDRQF